MDEKIIYIIFIVLSLAYSAYRKNQKKAKSSQQSAVGSQQPTPNSEKSDMEQKKSDRAIKMKTLLDKMLLGEEFVEPSTTEEMIPEVRSRNYEVRNQKSETESMMPEAEIREDKKKWELEGGSQSNVEELKGKEKNIREEISHRMKLKFNLKQAVINSVILERRY